MASRDLRNVILMSVSISKIFCFKFDDNITNSVYLVGQCLNLSSFGARCSLDVGIRLTHCPQEHIILLLYCNVYCE